MYPEKKHRGSYGTAMDHSMEDILEVSEQPQESSKVASTGLLSIKIPERLCLIVTVAKDQATYLTVMPCLSKESWRLSCLMYGY